MHFQLQLWSTFFGGKVSVPRHAKNACLLLSLRSRTVPSWSCRHARIKATAPALALAIAARASALACRTTWRDTSAPAEAALDSCVRRNDGNEAAPRSTCRDTPALAVEARQTRRDTTAFWIAAQARSDKCGRRCSPDTMRAPQFSEALFFAAPEDKTPRSCGAFLGPVLRPIQTAREAGLCRVARRISASPSGARRAWSSR
jgi:hypothetical protein